MIDVHSHILPGIDDGSRNVEMSLKMLREEWEQGIKDIFLTPHFYADMTDPEKFLSRRSDAEKNLIEAVNGTSTEIPKWILGAEVHYYRGIGRSEDIGKLCIGNSRYILLEPPFREWTPAFLEDVRALRDELDLKVIIAHIERYLDQDKHLVRELTEEPGVFLQANAEFFIDRRTRRRALKMLKDEEIDFLGTDAHNMEERRPNLLDAIKIIEDKLGSGKIDLLEENSERLLHEAE